MTDHHNNIDNFDNRENTQPENAPAQNQPVQAAAPQGEAAPAAPAQGEPVSSGPVSSGPASGEPASGEPVSGFTPHLTLDPNDIPETPAPPYEQVTYGTGGPRPGAAAEPFHMPEPPAAPDPSPNHYQQEPHYQAPNYQEPPRYTAPYSQEQPYQQPYQPNYYPQQYNTPPMGYAQKSRLAAGLLAIILGVFGVHNFYLGFNSRGTIQLILSLAGGLLTCGVSTVAVLIWSFIEGVMLLSANPSRMYDANNVILRD